MRKVPFTSMEDDEPEEEEGGGVGAAVLAFFLGLIVPIFSGVFTMGQDEVASLIVVAGFAGVILYSESQLTLVSGVSFGIGLTMTSFAASEWLMLLVSVAAVMYSLAKGGIGDARNTSLDTESGNPEPVLTSN
jgi:hypothetical protein